MRKRLPILRTAIAVLAAVVALTMLVAVFVLRVGSAEAGGKASGQLLDRIRHSPQYVGGRFVNQEATTTVADGKCWTLLRNYVLGTDNTRPSKPLASVPVELDRFASDSACSVVWLGHSTALIHLDGVNILIDPVFDDKVLLQVGSTQRFQPSPLRREDLPHIDVVLISHDHYDHLERSTTRCLAAKGAAFVVPLGVGTHLTDWGVNQAQVRDLDWWDTTSVAGMQLVCTPARHLSGRTALRTNQTLWCSWVIIGEHGRVFYGGDTGEGAFFGTIGDVYGPFDLTMLPIGGYGDEWPDIHLTPEQALDAHTALRGGLLLPVHWGAFDVAFHPWSEPITRLVSAARDMGVALLTPRLGEVVRLGETTLEEPWWTGMD